MSQQFDGQRQVRKEQEEGRAEHRYQRMLAELRGGRGRYIDLGKDTQFSGAWVMLGLLLTHSPRLTRPPAPAPTR